MHRHDVFKSRKCIHIRLTKEVHSGLRAKLFERGLSMQEVVDELSRLIAIDDKRLNKILDEYATRKVKDELNRLKQNKRPQERIGELEQDSLYDLISEDDEAV